MLAIEKSDGVVVGALLKAGANLNMADKNGMTALMFAAINSVIPGINEILLRAGANPSLKDKDGMTAETYITRRIAEEKARVAQETAEKEARVARAVAEMK